ncbi:D(1B) dopamine receptor-like [Entelurus aequoreus]|uniref:D(1B) dopamine receptor-like n=1 Tax=Entelurus aequoreus TaxID=161455 RepID=UPI002B1D1AAC|nr:D(1B) dopamine receptor-like [Entelurus aequoreus]
MESPAKYLTSAQENPAKYLTSAQENLVKYLISAQENPAKYLISAQEASDSAPMWNSSGSAATGDNGRGVASRAVTGCLLFLLILWTLLGNILVCSAVLRTRHLRAKVTNIFIVSLALSDLLVAVLVMPWKAVAEVAGYWPFGTFCSVWVAFDIMCSTASILNLCVISVDRYWAISSPFRYERKMTERVAFVMIAVTWTLSLLISFIPVQLNWHRAASGTLNSSSESCDSSLSREYAISSSLVSFYIPVAIMIVTYTRIYRIAQIQIRRIASLERAAEHAQSCRSERVECQHHNTLKTSIRRETKVFKTLSVIVGVFVCCWLPFFVLNCMVPFCERPPSDRHAGLPCVSETTFDVFVWFGWTNSSLNPVIYAFNADFRKAFAGLLGCRHFCSGTPVETVNISNEMVSYNQDTIFHKDVANAYVNMIPNVVECLDREETFDRISQFSVNDDHASDSVCDPEDCRAVISLDRMSPFTPNGLH